MFCLKHGLSSVTLPAMRMGAQRHTQASRGDWKVLPDNDLSDVFIGSPGRGDRQTHRAHRLSTPSSGQRSQESGRRSLMNVLVDEHSRPERGGVKFAKGHAHSRGIGFELEHQQESHTIKQPADALTSQILSELHGRGKPKPRLLPSPSSSVSPTPQTPETRPSAPTLRHRVVKQLADSTPRSSSALNFSERSFALNLVRSSTALSQGASRDEGGCYSPVSPRHGLSIGVTPSPAAATFKPQYDITQDRDRRQIGSLPSQGRAAAGTYPTQTKQPLSPSALDRNKFGSRDSGISNSELCMLQQHPSNAYNKSSDYIRGNSASTHQRISTGSRVRPSDGDVTYEMSSSDLESPRNKHSKLPGVVTENYNVDDNDEDDSVFLHPQLPNDSRLVSGEKGKSSSRQSSNTPDEEREINGDIRGNKEEKPESGKEEENEDDDLPEYLDSFQAASALTFRRPSLWNKVRDIGTSNLIHDLSSTRVSSSLGNSMTSGYGGSSIHSNDASEEGGVNKRKRCPNCGEELQRAPPTRFVTVRGNERNFLNWLMGHWGKVRACLHQVVAGVIITVLAVRCCCCC